MKQKEINQSIEFRKPQNSGYFSAYTPEPALQEILAEEYRELSGRKYHWKKKHELNTQEVNWHGGTCGSNTLTFLFFRSDSLLLKSVASFHHDSSHDGDEFAAGVSLVTQLFEDDSVAEKIFNEIAKRDWVPRW